MEEKVNDFKYTPEVLRKLQLVELEMLKELDRLCRSYNINYIVDGGTLLGAVRHGGFIPWDDDIDVRMLRKDYERFCEICSSELDKKYFLQTYKTDIYYRWGFARMLKNGTDLIRKNREELKSKTGIFIDIFPDDNLPENYFDFKYCTYVSLLCRKILYSEVGKKHAKRIWNRIGFAFLDLFPKKIAHNALEHLTFKYENVTTKKVRCFGWGAYEEICGIQKEWVEDTCDIKFEDIIVRAPVKTHEFLVHYFGENYMTPPPENERVPRHTATYIKF